MEIKERKRVVPLWFSTLGICMVAAVLQVGSLALELLHAAGVAKKKKKKKNLSIHTHIQNTVTKKYSTTTVLT